MDRHTAIAVMGLTKDRCFGGPISGAHYSDGLLAVAPGRLADLVDPADLVRGIILATRLLWE
jgi:hypothetical protein